MSHQVETNTYQTHDSEITNNIVSDCKEPYGQGQLFKGALFKFNHVFDSDKWF